MKEFAKKVSYDIIRKEINNYIVTNINKYFIHNGKDLWIYQIDNKYFQFIEINLGNGIFCYIRWGLGFNNLPVYLGKCKYDKLNIKKENCKYHIFECSKYEDKTISKGKAPIDGKTGIDLFSGVEYFIYSLKKYFKNNRKQISKFLNETSTFDLAISKLKSQAVNSNYYSRLQNPFITYALYLSIIGEKEKSLNFISVYRKKQNLLDVTEINYIVDIISNTASNMV